MNQIPQITVPLYLDKKGLATFLKVSITTIDQWRREGRIRYVKMGYVVRFNVQQVLEDLLKFTEPSTVLPNSELEKQL